MDPDRSLKAYFFNPTFLTDKLFLLFTFPVGPAGGLTLAFWPLAQLQSL